MRSVVDALKDEERRAVAALTPAERVALALRLGARDLETFRLAHDPPLGVAEARRRLRRQRQQGRLASRCLQESTG
ncbi:MAG TPA: hypothetical protein VMQ51_14035 [Candidatus Binatia bacterium]|nr:hypothetical protein [Candidatus Binatia bacterium]